MIMSQDEKSNTMSRLTRRRALAGLSVAAAAGVAALPAGAAAAPIEPDPIFAVIAEHRAAAVNWGRILRIYGKMRENDPNIKTARIEERTTAKAADACLWDVLHVQPTSLEGIAALLDYLGQPAFLDPDFSTDTVLSAAADAGDMDCPFARAVREFPARLAETMRGLIGRRS
jgi:hypothetical protein